MARTLLLFVRFHDGRYHGRPEWPPSPARLFQALVAAAANGHALRLEERVALAWLEELPPPIIASPPVRAGRGFSNYVPNNDLDAVGGDPRRIAEIRAPKFIKPLLFDASMSLLYAWQFAQGEDQASRICGISEGLYQLGRGVDMAWAWGEIIDAVELDVRLAGHGGAVYRPAGRGAGLPLACPQRGSFESLEARFKETRKRIMTAKSGRNVQQLFSQAPKPRFALVAYDGPPRRYLFVLRETTGDAAFAPWSLTKVSNLVERLRDRAAQKLKDKLPEKVAMIDAVFIGRNAKESDKAARIRIVPLPSIGSPRVVRSIRRLLVEVPPNCPLSAEDVAWAFSDLLVSDRVCPETGEVISETSLAPTDDLRMLRHYAIDLGKREDHRIWRTVTPAAFPPDAGRRRIDTGRLRAERQASRGGATMQFEEAKESRERLNEQGRAAAAVVQALHHAGVSALPETIRVQREPFESRGARAETFANGTRFAKERLWHVEIEFNGPVTGPLVIGDGRYLGLGIMAPLQDAWRDTVAFQISPEAEITPAQARSLLHAVRRALMALSRDQNGQVPRVFSGHEADGRPASSGRQEHVFLAADDADEDGRIDRLIIAAPWICDRSGERPSSRDRALFDRVVSSLAEVRAGRLGVIALGGSVSLVDHDPLIGPACVWQSRTQYRATRHAGRRKDPATALVRDVITECLRRGLPRPEVEILEFSAVLNGGGLAAYARLHFATAIRGPLLLGRDSHKGGGVFVIEK
jgi:CRISPR-associated protein Csb2